HGLIDEKLQKELEELKKVTQNLLRFSPPYIEAGSGMTNASLETVAETILALKLVRSGKVERLMAKLGPRRFYIKIGDPIILEQGDQDCPILAGEVDKEKERAANNDLSIKFERNLQKTLNEM